MSVRPHLTWILLPPLEYLCVHLILASLSGINRKRNNLQWRTGENSKYYYAFNAPVFSLWIICVDLICEWLKNWLYVRIIAIYAHIIGWLIRWLNWNLIMELILNGIFYCNDGLQARLLVSVTKHLLTFSKWQLN